MTVEQRAARGNDCSARMRWTPRPTGRQPSESALRVAELQHA